MANMLSTVGRPRKSRPVDPRTQALSLLRKLAPRPWDQGIFLDRLADHRGRSIVVLPAAMPVAMTGVWMATRQADYIFVTEAASHTRYLMIVTHEIAHILLGHKGAVGLNHPHVAFQTDEERDAEMVATAFTAQLGFGSAGWGSPVGALRCPSV